MTASVSADFARRLRGTIRGQVALDEVTRGIYATDASHYQVFPRCVVVPRDEEDVVRALQLAHEFGVPVTARGGGTSLSGQTTWHGMVLDLSKYLRRVIACQPDQGRVRVEAGLVRDELNQQLAVHGLHFAPDPATGNRAAIGGMIGNNSSGMRSILYGKTIDNLLGCRVALADGTVLDLEPAGPDAWTAKERLPSREGEIYRGVRQIIAREQEEIAQRFPRVMRRVGGYNLDAFLPPGQGGQPGDWNLSHLIVGSEGTLGVVLEATLKLHLLPRATALCVVHYSDIYQALQSVDKILEHHPSAVELLDQMVLDEARRNRTTAPLADFLIGEPQAILIVELLGETPEEAEDRAAAVARDLAGHGIGYAWPLRTDPAGQRRVWEVRKLGLGLIMNLPDPRKGQACIEDACVPTSVLADYIRQVVELCERRGVRVTLYAHASVGVIHARPLLDLHRPEDVRLMREIAHETFLLTRRYGGAWSGEHGDGLLRGEFVEPFFGPRIYAAFREVKQLFDPRGLMNPGKIIDAPPMTENLRYGPDYRPAQQVTQFHYRDQGSFTQAVEQCVGVGACRKTGAGTMCPSYMATRDEEHSTRGRANALRMAMSGQIGEEALTGDRLHEVLKLCLSCKACKSECPTSVDMARLKSDVLQMRHDRHGIPLAQRLLGRMPRMARWWAGPWAPLVNWVQELGLSRWCLERLAGIDRRRPLPRLHSQPLQRQLAGSATVIGPTDTSQPARGEVLLWIDTFTNFYEPHVGQAAIQLLQDCGYAVRPAFAGCCQRPQISQGLLREAGRAGQKTLQRLDQLATTEVPILVLEPSCASALADDLPDLVDDAALGRRVGARVRMIDQFLAAELPPDEVTFSSPYRRLLLHGHCHQKALFGTHGMKQILARVPGLAFEEIDAGCCGMAGAFGYQNWELSRKIGEDRLFPAVRDCDGDTEIVACGISCRHQLHDLLRVSARHWVEVIRAAPS